MLGRDKKKLKKDWTTDEFETVHTGIREKIGSNTRLWFLMFITVICLGVAFIYYSMESSKVKPSVELTENPVGHYYDAAHRKFEVEIAKIARSRGEKIEAKFLSDRAFKLVVPCDISADEMSYLPRAAAMGIWKKFKVSPVVWTYVESVNNSTPKLNSRTEWSKEFGDFVTKPEQAAVSP